jgi:hypothetical protein
MKHGHTLRSVLERALAFAHAALDEATPRYLSAARRLAEQVLPHVVRRGVVPEDEEREVLQLAGQLRALLGLLERELTLQARWSN